MKDNRLNSRIGIVVEAACWLKYDISEKLLERERLWLINF